MAKKRQDSTRWIQDLDTGGLHESTHTPEGQKIPASKIRAAKQGRYGPKAKRQAVTAGTLAKLRKRRK